MSVRLSFALSLFMAAATLPETIMAATAIEPAIVTVGQSRQVMLAPHTTGKQTYFRPGGLYLEPLAPPQGSDPITGQAIATTAAGLILLAPASGGLDILDPAAPGGPRVLGHFKSKHRYEHIALQGDTAYLAAAKHLDIVDLARPERPMAVGRFHPRTLIKSLVVADGVAAVLGDNHLQLVDVSRPKRTRQLAKLALSFPGESLAVLGHHLYLAAGDQGLLIIDISNPRKPRILKQFPTTGPVRDVALKGQTALLANGRYGITLLGVSNPRRPLWLGSHQQLGTVYRVRVLSGGRALAVNEDRQLFVLDIASPAMPSLLATLNLAQPLRNLTTAEDAPLVLLDSGLAKLVLSGQPPQISNEGLDFGQGVNYGGQRRLVIRDHIAYVADWFSGIHLYDLNDPRRPRLLSSLHTPGSPKGIVLLGDLAYVADDDHGLQVVDISDPRAPRIVANLSTPGLAYTPIVEDDLLFLASHRGGFQIIDIYNPREPRLLAAVDTPGKAWSIQVQKDLAYVAGDEAGLLIYDVLDPQSPRLIGRFSPGTAAEDVLIDGNIAYVAFFDDGLYVLDVSDPKAPKSVAHLFTPGNARGLARRGNRLYIADWLAGIHVVDISSPYRARIMGSYDTEGAAWGLQVEGRHVFVADWWGGLAVVDVSRPARPRPAGSYFHDEPVAGIATRDKYAYVAKGDDGFQVFDINNPLNPTWVTGVDLPGAHSVVLHRDRAYVGLADRIAVIDIGNPFAVRLINEVLLDHPVQILHRQGRHLFAGSGRRFSRIDTNGDLRPVPFTLEQPAVDLATDEESLYVLSTDGTIRAYDLTNPDRSRFSHRLNGAGPFTLLRAETGTLYAGLPGQGIRILRRTREGLAEAGFLALPVPLADLQVRAGRLFVVTADRHIFGYTRDAADAWRLVTEYRSQGNIGRLHLHDDILYLAGSRHLIAIQRLPEVVIEGMRASVPPTLPTGSYDLVIRDREGRLEQVYHNALTVAQPRFKQPRFTMEDLERILRQRRATEALAPAP